MHDSPSLLNQPIQSTKRTFEVLYFYLMGLADTDEVIEHIDKLATEAASP